MPRKPLDERTQATFYVATDGNDGWSGTLPAPNPAGTDGPFATLSRARDAIRGTKSEGQPGAPLVVMVRGGTYYLDETLVFGPQDSGTEDCPVTYMAYPGEEPVICGGREILAPCFEVDVAGTTGSGDCAVAGLLASLLRGLRPGTVIFHPGLPDQQDQEGQGDCQ